MSVRRFDPPTLGVEPSLGGPSQRRRLRPRSPAEFLEPSRAPERPKGRRRRRENKPLSGFVRLVSGVLTMVVIAMVLVAGGFFVVQHQFYAAGPLEASQTVSIPPGTGRRKVAEILEEQGIIANRYVFIGSQLAMSLSGRDRREFKAGEYAFDKGASMADVYETIVAGRAVLNRLTFPEGLTSQQIVERIKAAPDLTGEISQVPPEGSLMPDTYSFSKGMDRQELIDRMQQAHDEFLAQAWEQRQLDLPVSTPQEAVILASIVEKETGKAEERGEVAGVFVNRLRKGMRLQSDPTIIYGIAGGAGSLGRPIYKRDIEQKTAYNTYQIDRLPPTPICNPGRESITAVLNPAKTKNLFFVADGTGGHKFSETYKEHNAAVRNWRRIEREARKREAERIEVEAAAKKAAAVAEKKATSPVVTTSTNAGGASSVAVAASSSPSLLNSGAAGAVSLPAAQPPAPAPITGPVPLPARKPR